jgi:hypothetical protein
MEFLERSMTVSTRVDARALAELAKWQLKQGLGIGTRSKLVAQAVQVLAQTAVAQHPELRTETLEQAYQELSEFGLAPVSRQALQAMSRGLATEHLMLNHDSDRDMQTLGRRLERSYAGRGLAGRELQDKVGEQMNQAITKSQPLPDTHLGVDMVKARAILKQKLAESQPGMTTALDADAPGFKQAYQDREQDKLNKLKAGLGGDPRQA